VSALLGAPQVSIPIVAERHAIGLSLIAAPGGDLPLLRLVESLAGREARPGGTRPRSDHLL
jgi:Asp-tRNA(Asn)/Glu-tRNA(Gln) amidotransferase A subunit family amidase